MDFSKYLSVKDFLNYYVVGMTWLLNAVLLSASVITHTRQFELTSAVNLVISGFTGMVPQNSVAAEFASVVTTIVVPYLLGLSFSLLGNALTKQSRRFFGDPQDWLLDSYRTHHKGENREITEMHPEGHAHPYPPRLPSSFLERLHRHKRLSAKQVQLAHQRAAKLINGGHPVQKPNDWFFLLRAYVAKQGGELADLAARALDLTNLTESLLLPASLLAALAGYLVFDRLLVFWIAIVLGFFIFIGSCALLSRRYHYLRAQWVRHVYRAFLVLTGGEGSEHYLSVGIPKAIGKTMTPDAASNSLGD